jgi:hypothetical protein
MDDYTRSSKGVFMEQSIQLENARREIARLGGIPVPERVNAGETPIAFPHAPIAFPHAPIAFPHRAAVTQG